MEKYLKRKNEDDPPPKSKFLRKYNPDFIKYGFVNGGSEAVPRAQCVECGLTLSNEALKPSKLQRHLETKHPTLVGKPVEFFKRKEDGLQMQKRSIVSLTGNSKSALKASYLVARHVAQSKKPFTIAEELVLPAAVDMCREMIGEAAAKKLLTIPLSNDTVNISDSVSQHLSQLAEKFDDYFPEDPREGHMWILDPFSVDPTANDVALPSHLESQLLEVSTDSTLKLQWGKLDLGSFWVAVSKEYPCLALRAVKLLLPFTTTYLCESGFSILATTKTKARNRLRAMLEATLRVSLSPIPPRLDLIVSWQAQVSH
ncbi:Zinc finger MYM-type protein 6 [Larimichthys crocea]|uniref:Zinc finger MYM-type protein 6 n=1 Tax=Larimichthys crocea TaxID=215358 RepID=A0A6G0HMD9_LARCR|nr:Zinc finger MYM-type protein 6 [Larimichthys crocea]